MDNNFKTQGKDTKKNNITTRFMISNTILIIIILRVSFIFFIFPYINKQINYVFDLYKKKRTHTNGEKNKIIIKREREREKNTDHFFS